MESYLSFQVVISILVLWQFNSTTFRMMLDWTHWHPYFAHLFFFGHQITTYWIPMSLKLWTSLHHTHVQLVMSQIFFPSDQTFSLQMSWSLYHCCLARQRSYLPSAAVHLLLTGTAMIQSSCETFLRLAETGICSPQLAELFEIAGQFLQTRGVLQCSHEGNSHQYQLSWNQSMLQAVASVSLRWSCRAFSGLFLVHHILSTAADTMVGQHLQKQKKNKKIVII